MFGVFGLLRFPLTKSGYANCPDDVFEGVTTPIKKEAKPTQFWKGIFVIEGYTGETFVQDIEEFGEHAYGDDSGEFKTDLPDQFLGSKITTFINDAIENSKDDTFPVAWQDKSYMLSNFNLQIMWPIDELLENMPMVFQATWWKYRFSFTEQVEGLIRDAEEAAFDWFDKPITKIRLCTNREANEYEIDKRVKYKGLDYYKDQFFKYIDAHNVKLALEAPVIHRPTRLVSETGSRARSTTTSRKSTNKNKTSDNSDINSDNDSNDNNNSDNNNNNSDNNNRKKNTKKTKVKGRKRSRSAMSTPPADRKSESENELVSDNLLESESENDDDESDESIEQMKPPPHKKSKLNVTLRSSTKRKRKISEANIEAKRIEKINRKATRGGRGGKKGASKSVSRATATRGQTKATRGRGHKATRGRSTATRGGNIGRIASTRRTGQRNKTSTSLTPRKIENLNAMNIDETNSNSDSGSATVSEQLNENNENSDINEDNEHINDNKSNINESNNEHSESESKNEEISDSQLVRETARGDQNSPSEASDQENSGALNKSTSDNDNNNNNNSNRNSDIDDVFDGIDGPSPAFVSSEPDLSQLANLGNDVIAREKEKRRKETSTSTPPTTKPTERKKKPTMRGLSMDKVVTSDYNASSDEDDTAMDNHCGYDHSTAEENCLDWITREEYEDIEDESKIKVFHVPFQFSVPSNSFLPNARTALYGHRPGYAALLPKGLFFDKSINNKTVTCTVGDITLKIRFEKGCTALTKLFLICNRKVAFSYGDPEPETDEEKATYIDFDRGELDRYSCYFNVPAFGNKSTPGANTGSKKCRLVSIVVGQVAVFAENQMKGGKKKLRRMAREALVKYGRYDVSAARLAAELREWQMPDSCIKELTHYFYIVIQQVRCGIVNLIDTGVLDYITGRLKKQDWPLLPQLLDPLTARFHMMDKSGEFSILCVNINRY